MGNVAYYFDLWSIEKRYRAGTQRQFITAILTTSDELLNCKNKIYK